MIRRRKTSLLFAPLLLCSCASSPPSKPAIPASVSPGWSLLSLEKAALPSALGVPQEGSSTCWKGNYTGQGLSGAATANIWVCWYKEKANAFDALQRARAEAQMVKFQEGRYLVFLQWNNVAKTSLTALVRGIEKALQQAG